MNGWLYLSSLSAVAISTCWARSLVAQRNADAAPLLLIKRKLHAEQEAVTQDISIFKMKTNFSKKCQDSLFCSHTSLPSTFCLGPG